MGEKGRERVGMRRCFCSLFVEVEGDPSLPSLRFTRPHLIESLPTESKITAGTPEAPPIRMSDYPQNG
jgi:hypothetical protein